MKFNVGDRVVSAYDKKQTGTVRYVADHFYIVRFDGDDKDSDCAWYENEVEEALVPLTVEKANNIFCYQYYRGNLNQAMQDVLDYAKKHGIA